MLLYLSGNTKALMQRLPALLILLAAAVIVSPAWAADSRHAFRDLSVIWDTIEAICSVVSLEGCSYDITATGRVRESDKGDRNFEFQASEFTALSSDEMFSEA